MANSAALASTSLMVRKAIVLDNMLVAGVLAGDAITELDGQVHQGLEHQAVDRMRGPAEACP